MVCSRIVALRAAEDDDDVKLSAHKNRSNRCNLVFLFLFFAHTGKSIKKKLSHQQHHA